MVATVLEEAPRILTLDYRERSAERVLLISAKIAKRRW
jgi:hypothetical protein